MTSAMKLTFGISPNYKGPMNIEAYVRKIKTSKSLGRVISSYNKRYLVLDLNRMMFYYLSDRTSAFGSGSDIPLDSITRMYIDTDATTYMKEDQTWLHGVTILTTKKALRIKFDSRQTLDNWLFAFSNIVNIQTKEPIYTYPPPGTLPDEPLPKSSNSNNVKRENSREPGTPKAKQENNDKSLTAKRRDSSVKRQPIFSPSESDKVMKDFDNEEKQQHQPIIKAPKKKSNNSLPSSQGSVSASSEEVPHKEQIASIGKIKTPERIKRETEIQKSEETIDKEESKNKETNLKAVDSNGDRQQPEQLDSAQPKTVNALPNLDDLEVSHAVELDGVNTSKMDSAKIGGTTPSHATPSHAFRHVRNTSMSRRSIASGGISLLDDMKKSSVDVSNDNSKKNSWDEENSDEDKNKKTLMRRPSNLVSGNKPGPSRLSIRNDEAVKTAVTNIWKDNFSDAKQNEEKEEKEDREEKVEPVKQTNKDDWDDDWDAEDSKPAKNSFKQPNNDQTYNNKSTFSDFKPTNNVFTAQPAENKRSLEMKNEDFHTEKKPVHNDWDDEW